MRYASFPSEFRSHLRRRPTWRVLTSIGHSLLLVAALLAANAAAAPQRVEDFADGTWAHLVADLPRPAVVVFSTTYCAICPETFAELADTIARRHLSAPLVGVVMDGARRSGLLRDAHHARVDRLFVFRGQETALRYTVNKRWRGATPFVVLLPKEGAPVFVTGTPASTALDAWASAR